MSKLKSLALAMAGLLALSGPALAAVTVVNETDKAHTVTFDLGAKEIEHKVQPKGKVKEACPEGCGVRFGGHDAMAADGDTLAIKDGVNHPVHTAN
ncbi:MAG: hypothetical protein ACR2PO_18025 [Methyloligellaceae bacterium]